MFTDGDTDPATAQLVKDLVALKIAKDTNRPKFVAPLAEALSKATGTDHVAFLEALLSENTSILSSDKLMELDQMYKKKIALVKQDQGASSAADEGGKTSKKALTAQYGKKKKKKGFKGVSQKTDMFDGAGLTLRDDAEGGEWTGGGGGGDDLDFM